MALNRKVSPMCLVMAESERHSGFAISIQDKRKARRKASSRWDKYCPVSLPSRRLSKRRSKVATLAALTLEVTLSPVAENGGSFKASLNSASDKLSVL